MTQLKEKMIKRADEALRHAARTGEFSPEKLVDELLEIIGVKA